MSVPNRRDKDHRFNSWSPSFEAESSDWLLSCYSDRIRFANENSNVMDHAQAKVVKKLAEVLVGRGVQVPPLLHPMRGVGLTEDGSVFLSENARKQLLRVPESTSPSIAWTALRAFCSLQHARGVELFLTGSAFVYLCSERPSRLWRAADDYRCAGALLVALAVSARRTYEKTRSDAWSLDGKSIEARPHGPSTSPLPPKVRRAALDVWRGFVEAAGMEWCLEHAGNEVGAMWRSVELFARLWDGHFYERGLLIGAEIKMGPDHLSAIKLRARLERLEGELENLGFV